MVASDTTPTGEGTITGHIVIERADLLRALTELPGGRLVKRWAIATVLLLVVFPGIYFLVGDSQAGPMGWQPLLYPALFSAALFSLLIYGQRKAADRMLEGKTELHRTLTLTFSSAGFAINHPESSGHSGWSILHHHRETASAFVLYSTPVVFTVVPKRAFNETDVPALRALLQTHVKPLPKPSKGKVVAFYCVVLLLFVLIYQLAGTTPP